MTDAMRRARNLPEMGLGTETKRWMRQWLLRRGLDLDGDGDGDGERRWTCRPLVIADWCDALAEMLSMIRSVRPGFTRGLTRSPGLLGRLLSRA